MRRRGTIEKRRGLKLRIAYADPPYPGQARRRYGTPEVNHARLIERLKGFDGWALSTSARALPKLLPLCPPEARIAAWTKQRHANPLTRGIHNVWEPVIVVPARRLRPGVPDALVAANARGGDERLIGRKPIAFAAWLFGLLGAVAGDTFDDLYPGTGAVSRAWLELTRQAPPPARRRRRAARELSPLEGADTAADLSPAGAGDVSPGPGGDTSAAAEVGGSVQKDTPEAPPEPRADSDVGGPPSTADEIN